MGSARAFGSLAMKSDIATSSNSKKAQDRKNVLKKAVVSCLEQLEGRTLFAATPSVPDLTALTDSGTSSTDNVTKFNGAGVGTAPVFTGTIPSFTATTQVILFSKVGTSP